MTQTFKEFLKENLAKRGKIGIIVAYLATEKTYAKELPKLKALIKTAQEKTLSAGSRVKIDLDKMSQQELADRINDFSNSAKSELISELSKIYGDLEDIGREAGV